MGALNRFDAQIQCRMQYNVCLCVAETKSKSFSIILCACDKKRSVQVCKCPEAFAVCLCSHHIYHTTHINITFEFLLQQLFHRAIYGVIDKLPLVLTANKLSGNTSHRPMKIVFMFSSRLLFRSFVKLLYFFFFSLFHSPVCFQNTWWCRYSLRCHCYSYWRYPTVHWLCSALNSSKMWAHNWNMLIKLSLL